MRKEIKDNRKVGTSRRNEKNKLDITIQISLILLVLLLLYVIGNGILNIADIVSSTS